MGLGALIDKDYEKSPYSDDSLEEVKRNMVDVLGWRKGVHYSVSPRPNRIGKITILKRGYINLLHILDSLGYYQTNYEMPPEINSYIYDRAHSAVQWGLDNEKGREEVLEKMAETINEDDRNVILMRRMIDALIEAESNLGRMK